jgi:hypothetical protein
LIIIIIGGIGFGFRIIIIAIVIIGVIGFEFIIAIVIIGVIGFVLARQAFYQLSHTTSPFCF